MEHCNKSVFFPVEVFFDTDLVVVKVGSDEKRILANRLWIDMQ